MGRGQSGAVASSSRRGKDKRKVYKFDEEGIDDLEFKKDLGASMNREVVILVDVKKFDAAWKKDEAFYVGPNDSGAAIKGRQAGFREFLKKKQPIEMSRVYVTKDGRVSFINGRHRFSVLRDDRGAKKIPVTVDKSNAARAKKFFGT